MLLLNNEILIRNFKVFILCNHAHKIILTFKWETEAQNKINQNMHAALQLLFSEKEVKIRLKHAKVFKIIIERGRLLTCTVTLPIPEFWT